MTNEVPTLILGRYELKQQIARGGTSKIFLAHDRRLDRPVAVKILFDELSVDTAFVQRFRREAQAAANLNHPNIVSVYDWGEADGRYFIVMEHVDGRSLSSLLRSEGRIEAKDAAKIGAAVASALFHAHRHGVIHRDIKPGNVLITEDGRVKVTDFGIARALDMDESLTQTGLVMGTATYFSPEQAQGHGADGRSDIYSLGVVLYEMVSGRPPFVGETPVALALKHVQDQPNSLFDLVPGINPGYVAIVNKAMAKDPNKRYISAGELADDLERFYLGKPVSVSDIAESVVEEPQDNTIALGQVSEYSPRRLRRREPLKKASRVRLYSILLIVCALLLATIVFFAGRYLGYFGAPASLHLPSFQGMNLAEAENQLKIDNLKPIIKYVTNDAPVGQVIGQYPASGYLITEGSNVTLEVSNGPPSTKVPDLYGLDLVSAENELKADHLSYNAQGVFSNQPANTVISQTPQAGKTVRWGVVVTIQYSSLTASIAVPNVQGEPLNNALVALGQAGLTNVTPTYQASSNVPNGDVISVSPSPGTKVNANTPITLVVSSGASQNAMLKVIGDSQSVADSLLTSSPYDLVVVIQYEVTCAADVGIVVNQSIPGGVIVTQGEQVVLTIGEAPGSTTTSGSSTTLGSSSSSTSSSTSSTTVATSTTACP